MPSHRARATAAAVRGRAALCRRHGAGSARVGAAGWSSASWLSSRCQGSRVEPCHGGQDALAPASDTQKKTLKDDEAGTERVKALRAAWPAQVAGVSPENLVFADESGVNLAMTRTYARRQCGTRVPVFLTYLKKVLVPKLWPGAVAVMDNLPAHKVAGVQKQIEAVSARLLFLPPCPADFNPIEPTWSQFKSDLRTKAARTKRTLARAIREGLARLRPQDAQHGFAHHGYS